MGVVVALVVCIILVIVAAIVLYIVITKHCEHQKRQELLVTPHIVYDDFCI